MNSSITLGVYRRDDSPRKLELHNRRRDALHAVLDNEPNIQVKDWGGTDDSDPHEFVEVTLSVATTVAFQYAIVPGIKWLGTKLAEKAIDTALGELAKVIVAKLRPKQEAKELLDFIIKLPNGTQIFVDPPDRNATITIDFPDGSVEPLIYNYSKSQEEGTG